MTAEASFFQEVNTSFRFIVNVDKKPQAAFTECSLPTIDWETEEVKEGGLNTSVHLLPGRRKSARLTLKNGVGKNEMWLWCCQVMGEQFVRKPITITLLDPLLRPVATWHIEGAYPVKWIGPQLKSDTSAMAIQTIEFACGQISVEPNPESGSKVAPQN